ncbi:MAG: hypothetical protein JRF37_11475 [Deltaproteobacteria bacterium]|nr:hypothetical protein [Deltaproteobacteria bacterium]
MNIVLIGYRGTGKTAVGRALAERLKRLFYDADVFLEEKLATTIAEMVAKEGWNFFREKEKEVIRELSAKEDSVIATGGGAVLWSSEFWRMTPALGNDLSCWIVIFTEKQKHS